MKPEQWTRVKAVVQAAVELKAEDRPAYLDSACGSDAELRREAESLIAYQENASSFLESPAIKEAAVLLADAEVPAFEGQTIGPYHLLRKIGEGGMGEVYLAEDMRLGRKVALKLLRPELTNDESRVRRFHQEARAASALNHPNILTIFDIGEVDSTHFIATEYVKGETLRHRMSKGKMRLQAALDVATQVASGLAAAHKAGIVHRDIKPENIMLRADGYVKILDFGLAKLVERQAQTIEPESILTPLMSTEVGLIMGTPQYMSPEQVRGLNVDARSDIFSLGIVLYEMLTGRSPFSGATTGDVIAAILDKEPPPLMAYSPAAPAELQQIVSHALKKERGERYQVADAMVVDLKVFQQQERLIYPKRSTLRMWKVIAPRVKAIREQARVKTAQGSITLSEQTTVQMTSGVESPDRKITRHKLAAMLLLAAIIITVIGVAAYRWEKARRSVSRAEMNSGVAQVPTPQTLYSEMTEDERRAFVRREADHISALLGENPAAISDLAVSFIKKDVDSYAKRVDSLSERLREDGLRIVFGRASRYAPVIVPAFNARGVPPIIGLYIPMIESEYRACLEAPVGAMGIFQFMPEIAKGYGLDPKDRCKIEKVAPAAAQYIADRAVEFGSDSMSMTLVILTFNRDPDLVRRDLRSLRREYPNVERSYWSLFDNAEMFDDRFQTEGMRYVPKFFAAAIVGENPQAFNLQMPPLSTQVGSTR